MHEEDKLSEIITLLNSLADKKDKESRDHRREHEYLRLLIEEHKVKKETNLAILRKVTSGSIWAILVAMFSAAIYNLKGWLVG